MISAPAYNRVYAAFSDLNVPTSGVGVYDLKTGNLDPLGLKPVGAPWMRGTAYLVGEVVTPTAGRNGHTYVCTRAGTTAAAEPAWPLAEGAAVTDGGVTWVERTVVIANRVPAPGAPSLSIGIGNFASSVDVYVMATLTNGVGETLPSAATFLSTSSNSQGVVVSLPGLPGWVGSLQGPFAVNGFRLYEADVPSGSGQPAIESFALVGAFPLGASPTIVQTAAGAAPPLTSTARITGGMLAPPTNEAVLTRISTAGAFPVGRDVYVRMTYANAQGETTAGPSNSIINTEAGDQITAAIPAVTDYVVATVNVYEIDVPTGDLEPDASEYALVGSYAPGATVLINAAATGTPPPATNTTGVAGNIAKNSSTAGPNGTQGYRYAIELYRNRNGTLSGAGEAAAIEIDVDEDGWELQGFNFHTGPGNVTARVFAFTAANQPTAGPYAYTAFPIVDTLGNVTYLPAKTVYGQLQTSTLIGDNFSTSATFNFSDDYLIGVDAQGTDVTDRLQIIWPYPCVHFSYLPSVNRFAQSGVLGYTSGHVFSNAADAESYRGDTAALPIGTTGERAWMAVEYRGTIHSLRERSGFIITPNGPNPNGWNATQRWAEKGPCGPRAAAVCDDFILFVHRSGIWYYEDGDCRLVSREIPNFWRTINWAAAQTIWVAIDVEEMAVRIGVPTGQSKVPNKIIYISYVEGWADPVHFFAQSGTQRTTESCRKISIHDIAANVGLRVERVLPEAPVAVGVPVTTPGPTNAYLSSQFLLGSSAADGAVHAVVPGQFNDNGAGINWVYETVCPEQGLEESKIEGVQINVRGQGTLKMTLLGGRHVKWPTGNMGELELPVRDFALTPDNNIMLSRFVPSKINERWRVRISNGNVADAWAEVKQMALYLIPTFTAREEQEQP